MGTNKYFRLLFGLVLSVERFESYNRIAFATIPNYLESNPDIINQNIYSSIRTEGNYFIPTLSIDFDARCLNDKVEKSKKSVFLVTCGLNARPGQHP